MPGFDPFKVDNGPSSSGASRLEPEFAPHFQAWKADPSPANTDRFLTAVDPIIRQGVSVYGGRDANPMMTSRARRMAYDAAGKYDPTKSSLKTHLMGHFQGLRRYGARQSQVINVPEAVALDQHHLVEAEARLRDQLYGRDPSDAELADHTGLSRKRIRYIRGYRAPLAEGQAAAAGAGDDGEGGGWEPAVQGPDTSRLRAQYIYDDLPGSDQVILEYAMGLNGSPKLSTGDIARRLRITPGAVSQRAAKIQKLLDAVEDAEIF
jgi:DNA-directed RNA polymerase specialized sigma subunit